MSTPDSWDFSAEGVAKIMPLSKSHQQLISRIFCQVPFCISTVSVISALKSFHSFGSRFPFRKLSLEPERRGQTGFLRRQLLRTQGGLNRPLREQGREDRADPRALSVAPGKETSWGGSRPRICAPRPHSETPKALPKGQLACGQLELGLVGEGRRV